MTRTALPRRTSTLPGSTSRAGRVGPRSTERGEARPLHADSARAESMTPRVAATGAATISNHKPRRRTPAARPPRSPAMAAGEPPRRSATSAWLRPAREVETPSGIPRCSSRAPCRRPSGIPDARSMAALMERSSRVPDRRRTNAIPPATRKPKATRSRARGNGLPPRHPSVPPRTHPNTRTVASQPVTHTRAVRPRSVER